MAIATLIKVTTLTVTMALLFRLTAGVEAGADKINAANAAAAAPEPEASRMSRFERLKRDLHTLTPEQADARFAAFNGRQIPTGVFVYIDVKKARQRIFASNSHFGSSRNKFIAMLL